MREKELPAGNQGKVVNHFSKYPGRFCKKKNCHCRKLSWSSEHLKCRQGASSSLSRASSVKGLQRLGLETILLEGTMVITMFITTNKPKYTKMTQNILGL